MTTTIEVQSPCCLPLGVVRAEGAPALLGITLQYPPIQLAAKPHNELSVTGARANMARAQAAQWFERRRLPPRAEIEIELAIPAHMGLGSEAMLGLSVVRALAAQHGLAEPDPAAAAEEAGLGPEWRLEAWSHARGGVLVAGRDGTLIRRHALKHDEASAWVFVIYLPHAPRETPLSFEYDRRLALLEAEPGADLEPLWAALLAGDAAAFGAGLMGLQAGLPAPGEAVREALEVLSTAREAVAWGQSAGGLAAWGLIRGARPSQEARQRLRRAIGYEGGTVTAAVCDNTGATLKEG